MTVIHKMTVVQSGKHRLMKMTKTQVRNHIRDYGSFHGFLCGNRVNPAHIADMWHLGFEIDVDSLLQFEKKCESFETGLTAFTPELGQYPHYYKILDPKS